jgi:hypothetical protein
MNSGKPSIRLSRNQEDDPMAEGARGKIADPF